MCQPRRRWLALLLTLFFTVLACGQASPIPGEQTANTASPSMLPGEGDQLAPEAAQGGAPILIGTEYITIELPFRVSPLADMLEPLGLTAAKPLPENFAWGKMQSSPEEENFNPPGQGKNEPMCT